MNSRFAAEMNRWTAAQIDCQIMSEHVAREAAKLFAKQRECQQLAERVRVQQMLDATMPPLAEAA
jgi:Leu/Phe-tRNA-protein transferase